MTDKLIELIDKNDTISFDIFDTLIFRNIFYPTDIFKIMSIYAGKNYNIDNFYQIRIESEQNSRNLENNFECSYNDIYNNVNKKIKNKKVCDELKKYELELELEFCIFNPYMKSIFNYCNKNKKRIFLISDMYLDESFINKILQKNGYKDYKLFVSSKYKKNKGTKELFKYVHEKMKVDKSKWLHIGDSEHSDYKMPKEFGINAYNYKKVTLNCNIVPDSIFESIILAIQCNYLYNGNKCDYWEAFGVKYISPIYFGFTKWLYDLTKNKDNLFFLARDGYIINEIYKLFDIKDKYTKYIYCSRESLQIPAFLIDNEDDNLINFITENGGINYNMTLNDLLNRSGIDTNNISRELIGDFGFKSLEDDVNDNNYYYARKLVSLYLNDIKDNLVNKLELAKEYLIQEKMNQFDEINIVDIGWSGSIQSSISKILNRKVCGYYFGTVDSKKNNAFTSMYGYYFDLDHPILKKSDILDNVMMYELIFCAPHGTTIRYEKKDDNISPILSSNTNNNKCIESFQNSALTIIKKYLKYYKYYDFLSKDFCVNPYLKFIKEKEYNDLINFEKLYNDVLVGVNEKFKYVEKIEYDDFKSKEKVVSKLNDLKKCLWNGAFILENSSSFFKQHINNLCLNNMDDNYCFVKLDVKYNDKKYSSDCFYIPYYIVQNNYSFSFDFPHEVKEVNIILAENQKVKINNLIINTNCGNASVKIKKRNLLKDKLMGCIFINSNNPVIKVDRPERFVNLEFSADIVFF